MLQAREMVSASQQRQQKAMGVVVMGTVPHC